MRKFRLKKWYPSLPNGWKEGKVLTREEIQLDNWVNIDEVLNNPEFWEEVKKPLFTAEDGVNIYEGDCFFLLNNSTYKSIKCTAVKTDKNFSSDRYKVFSNKKSLEEYRDKHEPRYSIKDIQEILGKSRHISHCGISGVIVKDFLSKL